MKTNIKWTILFIAMMIMAMFLIKDRDIQQMSIFISFWLSIACQFLEDIKIELLKQNMEEDEDNGLSEGEEGEDNDRI